MTSPYVSNIAIDDVADLLRGRRNCLVTTHAKPDADAVGAVVSVLTAINHSGGQATGRLMPPVPVCLEPLMRGTPVSVHDQEESLELADLVVVVDTGAWTQLEPMRSVLETHVDHMLIIDHHLGGDVPARWRWIDRTAAACCEMLVSLIECMGDDGEPFSDPVIRNGLYAGMATDTGWFRFSNTHAGTLRAAARLLEAGVDHASLYQQFEQNARPAKLRLLSAALEGSRFIAEERAIVMALGQEDFCRAGAQVWETERLVDVPQMVGSVEVVVLATEVLGLDPGLNRVRLSFRSKPGPHAVDVARLAAQFGGGGHARAAGGQMDGALEVVLETVCGTVEEAIRAAHQGA